MMRARSPFPNPADTVSVWLAAAGVAVMCAAVAFDQRWVLVPLSEGFVARMLAVLSLSPLALLAMHMVTRRLPAPATPVRARDRCGRPRRKRAPHRAERIGHRHTA